MTFTSQPAEVSPDEAAARFTRATELLMRGAERRKAAQRMAPPVAPLPHLTANGRFVRRENRSYPSQMGGAA